MSNNDENILNRQIFRQEWIPSFLQFSFKPKKLKQDQLKRIILDKHFTIKPKHSLGAVYNTSVLQYYRDLCIQFLFCFT